MADLANHGLLENGMALAQQPVFTVNPHFRQALAWQDVRSGSLTILDKTAVCQTHRRGSDSLKQRKIGAVILCNGGK